MKLANVFSDVLGWTGAVMVFIGARHFWGTYPAVLVFGAILLIFGSLTSVVRNKITD